MARCMKVIVNLNSVTVINMWLFVARCINVLNFRFNVCFYEV